jgi:hypothetical protein
MLTDSFGRTDSRLINVCGRTLNLVGLRPCDLRTRDEAEEFYYQICERILSVQGQLEKAAVDPTDGYEVWRAKANSAIRYLEHNKAMGAHRIEQLKQEAANDPFSTDAFLALRHLLVEHMGARQFDAIFERAQRRVSGTSPASSEQASLFN